MYFTDEVTFYTNTGLFKTLKLIGIFTEVKFLTYYSIIKSLASVITCIASVTVGA